MLSDQILNKAIVQPVKLEPGYKPRYPIPTLMKTRRDPMFDLFPKNGKVAVEIGSQWGWWAWRAATHLPSEAIIYCVDPWSNNLEDVSHYLGGEKNLWDWSCNLKKFLGHRIIGLRGTTKEIAPGFNDEIDLLFLDGDHTKDGLLLDLKLWVPKMASGGVIIGHDWAGPWSSGVKTAVREFFGRAKNAIEVAKVYWTFKGRELSPCWIKRL